MREFDNWPKDIHPDNYEMKKNPIKQQIVVKSDGELVTEIQDLDAEQVAQLIGGLAPLATAALEKILRNPTKHAAQVVQAAKMVYERKLGAVPDTVIQNNMQFIVKWEE